jgi:C4-dicarboxylate transporter, DctM subunit
MIARILGIGGLGAIGAPFFAILAILAMWGFASIENDPLLLVVEFNRIAEMPVLVAIPLFTLAGYLLSASQAPVRLVRLANASVGWMPGGFAIMSILACSIFTVLTGASGVTIVALGAVLLPALRHGQYDDKFSLGLLTTSGSLGMLFAPALPLIIYGVVAQQLNTTPAVEMQDLFVAGLLPGILMIVALSIYSVYKAPKTHKTTRFDAKELFAAMKDSWSELPLPVVVLIGVLSGAVPPSEIAALTAAYVIVVYLFVRREIKFAELPTIVREAMMLIGAIFVILGMSLALTNYFITEDIPSKLFAAVKTHIDSKITFLMILNIFLLVFGMLLEGIPAIVILTPLLLPIAIGYGIHPVHFGIMFVANLQIGLFLPPVGMNLFIASMRFNESILRLVRACVPFFLILFACVLIITYVPSLSLMFID